MGWFERELVVGTLLGLCVMVGFLLPRVLLRLARKDTPDRLVAVSILGSGAAILIASLWLDLGAYAWMSAALAFYLAWWSRGQSSETDK